jgi:hypothetical protein
VGEHPATGDAGLACGGEDPGDHPVGCARHVGVGEDELWGLSAQLQSRPDEAVSVSAATTAE